MKQKTFNFKRHKGVAAITAILVLAIAATAATTIAANYQLDMRRTENMINSSQAWAYAKGAEQWTQAILARDLENSSYDGLDEDWAIELPPFELPGGYIIGKIEDAQGKINLNSLIKDKKVDETMKQRVSRLLSLLELNPGLVDAIIDWIDEDVNPAGPDGAERDIYIGLEFAYLPADQLMADISELRLVKGFDQDTYNILLPHVTTLPANVALNLNTASAEVLASLSPKIALELANDLVKDREDDPYEQPIDFLRHPLLQGITIDVLNLSVTSDYFNLTTKAVIGNSKVKLTSTIHRSGGNALQVVKRSQKI